MVTASAAMATAKARTTLAGSRVRPNARMSSGDKATIPAVAATDRAKPKSTARSLRHSTRPKTDRLSACMGSIRADPTTAHNPATPVTAARNTDGSGPTNKT